MLNFQNINSVVIIGASTDPKKIGNILLAKNQDFPGKIYGVNPKGGSAFGKDFYPSISDLPEVPDIAVFAIPEAFIYDALESAGKYGIKKAIIITAGFKEIGNTEGEEKIIEIAKKYNIRFLGPNCLGYGDTSKKLNLSFGGSFFTPGNIGIISQSGAMAVAITDILDSRHLGFSSFFSLGNKTNIDETDILKDLSDDTNTHVIGIYLESISRGGEFIKTLKETTSKKPVIIMIGGVSGRGKLATASHTGSLSGDKNMYEAAVRQGGAILTYSLSEFFDLLQIFSQNSTKNIEGNPFIITNAGGPGVLTTDQCEFNKLDIATIDSELNNILRKNMPTMMSTKNPIDIIGDADSTRVGQILENIATARKKADIIFLFTIQATTDIDTIADTISDFYKNHKEYTIFVGLIGGETIKIAQSKLLKEGIFVSTSTESIISAYTHLLREKTKDIKPKNIQKTITPKKDHTIATLMNQNDTEKLLKEYKINTTHTNEYESLDEILTYVEKCDGPFVMKIGGKNMIHKTELGGVIGPVQSLDDIRSGYDTLSQISQDNGSPKSTITIGKYVHTSPKIELFFGAKRDPLFGDTFIIGAGGIFLTILDDTRIHIGEWEDGDIHATLSSLRSYDALTGFRKQQEANIGKLEEMIKNLSRLFFEHREIREIDINPILFDDGVPTIADAKLYIE